ncbi:hypothetical protein, partial [Zooshikella harenae]
IVIAKIVVNSRHNPKLRYNGNLVKRISVYNLVLVRLSILFRCTSVQDTIQTFFPSLDAIQQVTASLHMRQDNRSCLMWLMPFS